MLRASLALGSLFAAALLSTCGDDAETQDAESPARTATPASTRAPTPSPTSQVTPGPTQPTTLPPIPEDWPRYYDPAGLYSIRYPSNWFEIGGNLYATDLRTYTGYDLPAETVKVEVNRYEAIGSTGCGGALEIDPATGEATPEPGATAVTLGGLPAWQIMRGEGEGEGGTTRIQAISLIYKGTCVILAGYFTQRQPDVTTYIQMASTFEFKA